MIRSINNWKTIVDDYHEKAVTLSILIFLFAFLVSPAVKVKPFQKIIASPELIVLPPDIKDVIPPPKSIVRPNIDVIFDDDLLEDEGDKLDIITSIPKTVLDPYNIEPEKILGKTSIVQIYEDAPVLIKQINPEYSDLARNLGIEGIVELEVEIFTDGSVGAVRVLRSLLSGPYGLDEAAVDAVKQWEFQPARSNGIPVAVWVSFSIEFGLE